MNKSNIKKFRILYNKLDEVISDRIKEKRNISFIQKLNKFINEYPSYKNIKDEVRLIHDLRNVIIHEEKYLDDITIPTDAFLDRIADVIKHMNNPQTAIDIASTCVYCCCLDDKISDVIQVMAEKIYSQVPVLSDKNKSKDLIGVFSEACIAAILGEQGLGLKKEVLLDDDSRIEDIIEIVKEPINEGWDFIPKDLDVYKVQELFHNKTFKNAKLENARLGVLFVTEQGKRDEKILGVITTWDLSRIERLKNR